MRLLAIITVLVLSIVQTTARRAWDDNEGFNDYILGDLHDAFPTSTPGGGLHGNLWGYSKAILPSNGTAGSGVWNVLAERQVKIARFSDSISVTEILPVRIAQVVVNPIQIAAETVLYVVQQTLCVHERLGVVRLPILPLAQTPENPRVRFIASLLKC